MDSYKVEYLSVINSKEDFCKSIASFNSFLQSYDNVKIAGGKIKYEGSSFAYDVQFGDIVEGSQRYFHVRFVCGDANAVDVFKKLLRVVRTLLVKVSGKPPEVLWDDIGSELSQKAYPVVHELENLMRKLITKFMFIKIGITWTKDAVPKEVSESLKMKKEVASHNYLYEVDFIQLSNFLFKEYSTANSRKLVDALGKAKKIEELDLLELQELVPRSNWERYFSPIVNCKIEYLQPRWERLYLLRCMIAHNNLMSDSDYEEVCLLSGEVKDKLTQALEGLDKIQVSSEQKEDVAENIASEINTDFGDFIHTWNSVLSSLYHLASLTGLDAGRKLASGRIVGPPGSVVAALLHAGLLTNNDVETFGVLSSVRNSVVHEHNFSKSEENVKDFFPLLKLFQNRVAEIIGQFTNNK